TCSRASRPRSPICAPRCDPAARPTGPPLPVTPHPAKDTSMTSQTSTGPVGVGLIGAGTISAEYLTHLTSFPDLVVHLVGDLFPAAAAVREAVCRVPSTCPAGL